MVFVGNGKGADALEAVLEAAAARISGAKIQGGGDGHVGGVAYSSAVSGTHLPKARDRLRPSFHVVKLFNEKTLRAYAPLYREATDMMHKEVLKGTRWLLLKNPENLDKEKDEKRRLDEALKLNEPLAMRPITSKDDLRLDSGTNPESGLRPVFWTEVDSSGLGVLLGSRRNTADGQDVWRLLHSQSVAIGLLRCDDFEWSHGRDEQQDQNDEATGVRISRHRVLQTEDPRDP